MSAHRPTGALQTRPPLDRARSLDARPIVNDGLRLERQPDGTLHLVVRMPRRSGLFARFLPPIVEKRVQLDELGSFVFDQIDGTRSVREILDAFVARYRNNRREAEYMVTTFLRQLTERRLITLVIP